MHRFPVCIFNLRTPQAASLLALKPRQQTRGLPLRNHPGRQWLLSPRWVGYPEACFGLKEERAARIFIVQGMYFAMRGPPRTGELARKFTNNSERAELPGRRRRGPTSRGKLTQVAANPDGVGPQGEYFNPSMEYSSGHKR